MLKLNPATGLMEDDYAPEPAGGLVAQQDQAAATSPTFVDSGSPPSEEGVSAFGAPLAAPGADDVMPPTPEEPTPDIADLPPPAGMPVVQIPDQPITLADASQTSAPDIGEPPGLPGAAEPPQLSDVTLGAPPPKPGMLVPPLAPPGGAPGPGPDVTKPGEIDKPQTIADQRVAAVHEEAEIKAKVAKAEAERAQADLDQKVEAKQEEDQIIGRSEQRIAERRAARDAEYAKYKDMSVQDAWGDNGTAKRVLAGIAMILGGRLGAAVVIGAAQGLEEKKRTELALQEKVMAQAGRSLEEIKDQTAEDMAAFKNRQAAAFGVTAARLEQEKRAQGIPENKIAEDKEIIAIKAAEQKANLDRKKLEIDAENDRLKMDLVKEQTRMTKEHADLYARTKGKGAKGSGGGGGGKGGVADRAQAVADAIRDGAMNEDGTRRELSYGEKIAVAKQNGIPLNGKSSETTLDTINKTTAFDVSQSRKGTAAEDKKQKAKTERETNVIKDPWTGAEIGPAPSTRGLTVARKDQAQGVQLVDTLKEYRDHLAKYGDHIGLFGKDGLSRQDILTERSRLWADAAGNRRVWSNLPSSEAGLDLEKAQMGGTGKLWDIQPTSVHTIDSMINEVQRVTNQRSNILAGKPANWKPTAKGPPAGDEPAAPAGEPKTPSTGANAQKAKDIQSGFPVDQIQKARAAAAGGNPKAEKWLTDRGLSVQ